MCGCQFRKNYIDYLLICISDDTNHPPESMFSHMATSTYERTTH